MNSLRHITREEWLELRRQSIGGSEAAAACGQSPYLSELELWGRKRGLIPDQDLSGIEHVRWGNLLEPAIVAETCQRLGLRELCVEEAAERLAGNPQTEIVGVLEGRQLFLRSIPHPHMTATLDGLAVDSSGALVSIEAKNSARTTDWSDGQSPMHYRLQVMHQLAVAQPVSRGILAGLVNGNRLEIAPAIERDTGGIEAMIMIEGAFWMCVTSSRAPQADGSPSSAHALKILHPDDDGSTIELASETQSMHDELSQLQDEIREREKRARELRTLLTAAIGSHTYGVLPDGTRYSLKTQEREEHLVSGSKFRVLRHSKGKS
jgi:predicted phage-related endonuclease